MSNSKIIRISVGEKQSILGAKIIIIYYYCHYYSLETKAHWNPATIAQRPHRRQGKTKMLKNLALVGTQFRLGWGGAVW